MTEEAKPVEKTTEEVKIEKQDDKVEAKPDYETPARESGWTPKEDFKGDPEKWVDAKEWVERAPLFDEMKKLRRKAKALEGTVNQLKDHYQRVEENAYKRAVDTLKAEKMKALEEGDHKRVMEVDDELDELRNKKVQTVQAPQVDPAYERWLESNTWYDTNAELREYADFVGLRYARENPGKSPEEYWDYAARRTREQFPDRFQNARRSSPSPVEGGSKNTTTRGGKPRWSELPEHFQKAGDRFVRQGVMTREQYIDDLIKIGEIKI